MNTQFLLHQDGQWLAFEGATVKVLETRPKVDRSSVVVTDFDGAVSDVTALEGSSAHAVALIERRLRGDGLLETDSKILIHQLRTVGNGYQVLFTAVPIDRWQQTFAWADSQDDHCLLVPTVALLWKKLRPGRGVVLHSGRKLVFLASLRGSMVYASALAFSDSREDLSMTVAALGGRASRLLSAGDDALEPLTVEWIGTLTRLHDPSAAPVRQRVVAGIQLQREDPVLDRFATADETPIDRNDQRSPAGEDSSSVSFDGQSEYVHAASSSDAVNGPESPGSTVVLKPATVFDDVGALDEDLLEIFAANSGATVILAPYLRVSDSEGLQYRSGIPPLMQAASVSVAVNSPAARAISMAERVLPWASAASLILALGLGVLGGRWTLAAHEARGQAEALQGEVEALDLRASALEQRQAMPPDYPALLAFIDRATALSQALDPAATLLELRAAAGSDVRILRLRLDTTIVDKPSLRVDGVVNFASSVGTQDQGQQLARFVQRLRDAGYVPTALDPQGGGARAGAAGGLFSYQLTRLPTTPTSGVGT